MVQYKATGSEGVITRVFPAFVESLRDPGRAFSQGDRVQNKATGSIGVITHVFPAGSTWDYTVKYDKPGSSPLGYNVQEDVIRAVS